MDATRWVQIERDNARLRELSRLKGRLIGCRVARAIFKGGGIGMLLGWVLFGWSDTVATIAAVGILTGAVDDVHATLLEAQCRELDRNAE